MSGACQIKTSKEVLTKKKIVLKILLRQNVSCGFVIEWLRRWLLGLKGPKFESSVRSSVVKNC